MCSLTEPEYSLLLTFVLFQNIFGRRQEGSNAIRPDSASGILTPRWLFCPLSAHLRNLSNIIPLNEAGLTFVVWSGQVVQVLVLNRLRWISSGTTSSDPYYIVCLPHYPLSVFLTSFFFFFPTLVSFCPYPMCLQPALIYFFPFGCSFSKSIPKFANDLLSLIWCHLSDFGITEQPYWLAGLGWW